MAALAGGRGGGDARDHRRQRGVGQPGVKLAGPERARVRRQRPELAVGQRLAVHDQHLGVAAEDAEPATEQLELARRLGGDRRAGRARGGEGVFGRVVVRVVEEGVAHRRRGGGREGVDRSLRRWREGVRLALRRRRERVGRACGRGGARTGGRSGRSGRTCGRGGTRGQPARPARLRPPIGVLPVVAASVVERRIRAERNQPEAGFVGDVHDLDRCHGRPTVRQNAASTAQATIAAD